MTAMGLPEKKPGGLLVVLGKHHGLGGSEDEDDEEKDPLAVSDEQVDAMREFEAAKGPEERAQALKAFINLCEEEDDNG